MSDDKSPMYEKIIKESTLIQLWENDMIFSLQGIDPSLSKNEIQDVLEDMLMEQLQIPEVHLHNNYTHEERDTNVISVADWALTRKPIMAGNGTFYKSQDEALNPTAVMLSQFLKDRKDIKKRMFQLEDVLSDMYAALDRAQGNKKMLANSYYGGSGMPKSAFYSLYSGPATTHSAQEVISTAETLFEGLLVDNYKFIDIDEVFHYMNTIKREYSSRKKKLDSFIKDVSVEKCANRITYMIHEDYYKDEYEEIIFEYVRNLSHEERSYLYYKYNLFSFILDHDKIKDYYYDIFSHIKNYEDVEDVKEIPRSIYNTLEGYDDTERLNNYHSLVCNEAFMNPNNPPESIKKELEELNGYLIDYVYTEFMSIDRIYRLKFFPRKTVCIVDKSYCPRKTSLIAEKLFFTEYRQIA